MSWLFDDDDQIFEDDNALLRKYRETHGGSLPGGSGGPRGVASGSGSGGAGSAQGSENTGEAKVFRSFTEVPETLNAEEYLKIVKQCRKGALFVYSCAAVIFAAVAAILYFAAASDAKVGKTDTACFALVIGVVWLGIIIWKARVYTWDYRKKTENAEKVFEATASPEERAKVERADKKRAAIILGAVMLTLSAAAAAVLITSGIKTKALRANTARYNEAVSLIDGGDYSAASEILGAAELKEFKNSKELRTFCKAAEAYAEGNLNFARTLLREVSASGLTKTQQELYCRIIGEYNIAYPEKDYGGSGGSGKSGGSGSSGKSGTSSKSGGSGASSTTAPWMPSTKYFSDPEDFYDYYYDDFYDYEEAEEYYYSHGGM